ncbi:Agenet-like domain-containing protein [Heracleum sosnowskyi]|uniref:Agenet-like domain-containing protein n=1 Tax=Heracleum sosnowskyi TaxID=360622 RepID=A0AAD8HUL0_9APIA|nr:Agenet-like domain-containing protein [Heracleum sosnowskyi]
MKKTLQIHHQLLVNQKVEVRNFDEGLLGSWHSGTVIACENEFVRIRYDYLLRDDDSRKCVIECVRAPSVKGGSRSYCRGWIRPLPPKIDPERWSLQYGHCVDVFHKDAWWEGVVFDHEDESPERMIFLPDTEVEIKAHKSNLRITHDWDVVNESWKPREGWKLLKLIEKIKEEKPVMVSIKQIWYDVRAKTNFRYLKDWTSPCDDVWMELVREVAADNFKLSVEEYLPKLNMEIRTNGRKREVCNLNLESSSLKRKKCRKIQTIELRDNSSYTIPAPIYKNAEGILASKTLCSPAKARGTFKSQRPTYARQPKKYSSSSLSSDISDNSEIKAQGVKKRRRKSKISSVVSASKLKTTNKKNIAVSRPVSRSRRRVHPVMDPSFSNSNPQTVLSWLIDKKMLLPMSKVYYRGRENDCKMTEGRVTHNGIMCSCCQDTFTLSSFEAHAGTKSNRPSANIYLEDGTSLLKCQMQLKCDIDAQISVEEPCQEKIDQKNANDDICAVCHHGGSIIMCDGCPSSFHTVCLGLESVPYGDWFCPSCCCKICGGGKTKRDMEDFKDSVMKCHQCERISHTRCLNLHSPMPQGIWFCDTKCEKIYLGLQNLLRKPVPVGTDNLTWTLLKNPKSKSCQDSSVIEESTEIFSKLNVAVRVMHECFHPFKELRTGNDLVEDVIFNRRSEQHHLNYEGFYTILLEKNEELITVATVRVLGEEVAEVPLVATRFLYRQRGMCHTLMNELEKVLVQLGVQRVVLPAASSALDTWISSFGFSVMTKLERQKFFCCNFLGFISTTMCQKILLHNRSISVPVGNRQQICDDRTGNNDTNSPGPGSTSGSEVSQRNAIIV